MSLFSQFQNNLTLVSNALNLSFRMGDINLAHTVLHYLRSREISNNLHRSILISVIEEFPYLISDYGDVFFTQNPIVFKDLQRFIFMACLAPKSKDHLTYVDLYENDFQTLKVLQADFSEVENVIDYFETENIINFENKEDTDPSILLLLKIYKMGGRISFLKLINAAAFILSHRGVDKENVKQVINKNLNLWFSKNGGKPKLLDTLPPLIYLMDSYILSKVKTIYLKNYGNKLPFNSIFFDIVIDTLFCILTPSSMLLTPKNYDNIQVYENLLYKTYLEDRLKNIGITIKGLKQWWVSEARDQVYGIIDWCLHNEKNG